jgi:membrane-associated HD superfamily phosphohydrolase
MIPLVNFAEIMLARFENSRQFANAVMHPESQEAIMYRRVQTQRLETFERTEKLGQKIKQDVEDAANALYASDKSANEDKHTEISYDTSDGTDNAKMSFRRRLVDILVYVYIFANDHFRAQQNATPGSSIRTTAKPAFLSNPTGQTLLSNVDNTYDIDGETASSLLQDRQVETKADPDILVQMFYDYFDTAIKSHNNSKISHDWIDNITQSIPVGLADSHPEILHALLEEVKIEYTESGKLSAVKHILKRPPMHRSNDPESCNDDYLFLKDKCPFPSGWRAGYIDTREKISRTLYLTHPLMIKILKVINDSSNT